MSVESTPDNRPLVYVEDGTTIYRASSLLQCPRAFIFSRAGHESKIAAPLQAAFDYGTNKEPEVVQMLLDRGYTVTSQQLEVQLQTTVPNVSIRGHIDGIIGERILEIKCLSHENTEKFRNDYVKYFPYYAYQISVYMLALGKPAFFAIYDKDEDELHEIVVNTMPIPHEPISKRIHDLEETYSRYQHADVLPSCETTTYCPFFYLHEEYSDAIPTIDPITAALVHGYAILDEKIKALEDTKSKLREKLEDRLQEISLTHGRSNLYDVSYQRVTSARLDSRAVSGWLRSNAPAQLEEFTKKTTSQRLTVKLLKEKDV